ncbi:MAG TPA: nuclear transport factor 2 family protein [Saprospiraceae bacterium]|nr:nuclear transport factor 2 family protein [Saprospiraceae bacterium]
MKKQILLLIIYTYSGVIIAQSSLDQQIVSLSRAKNEWMIQKDTFNLQNVFTKDLQYVHSSGRVDNYSSILKIVGSKESNIIKQELYDASVRVNKSSAVLIGKLRFKALHNNEDLDYTLYITEVWIKQKRKWKLWSRHASTLSK